MRVAAQVLERAAALVLDGVADLGGGDGLRRDRMGARSAGGAAPSRSAARLPSRRHTRSIAAGGSGMRPASAWKSGASSAPGSGRAPVTQATGAWPSFSNTASVVSSAKMR